VDEKVMDSGKIARVALIIMLLLATLLRMYRLDSKSLESDEIFTVGIAAPENTWLDVLSIPLHNTPVAKPAFYFLIAHLFLCVEDHDFLLRFPSLAFGVLSVAATYAVGTALFGRKEGLVAALLLCISPLHIRYSQMARFYSLLMAFSLFSLYFFYRGTLTGERRSWIGFTVVTVLNLYTHLFAFLILLSESLFFLLLWLRGYVMRRGLQSTLDNPIRNLSSQPWVTVHRRSVLILVVSLMIVGLAYLPMVPHVLDSLGGPKGIAEEAETPGLELSLSFFEGLLAEWSTGPGIGSLIFIVLFVTGLLAALRNQRMAISLALLWMVVPFAVLFIVPMQHRFYPRYLIFLLPLYLIVIAGGVTACGDFVAWAWERIRRKQYRGYWVGLAVGLVILSALSMSPLQVYYREIMSDWRAAAVFLANAMSPGETIVVRWAPSQIALVHYDGRLKDAEFRVVTPQDPLPEDLQYHEGIWFVGKEGRNSGMSKLEDELTAMIEGPLVRTVFEGYGDHYSPGAGESMFWDVWILHTQ
jgi:uncharacterized membrane protein